LPRHHLLNQRGDGGGGIVRVEENEEISGEGVGGNLLDPFHFGEARLQQPLERLRSVKPFDFVPGPPVNNGMNGLNHVTPVQGKKEAISSQRSAVRLKL
jgi:hypothetical protein